MSSSTPDACTRLAWDSEFFGVSIARVLRTRVTTDELAAARRWAREASIDCLYLLAEAEDDETVRAAEQNGFSLVDVRVTLDRAVAAAGAFDDAAIGARRATPEDLPRLTAIARVSHRNTRFHRDPRFDPTRADELYAVWIERAVRGEQAGPVWVVDGAAGASGYLTLSRDADHASIGLVAMDASARGQGGGGRLLEAALHWSAEQGVSRLSVVTQGHQAASMRFYERRGFATRLVQFWYHFWTDR